MRVKVTITGSFIADPMHYGDEFTEDNVKAIEQHNLEENGIQDYLDIFSEEDLDVKFEIMEDDE